MSEGAPGPEGYAGVAAAVARVRERVAEAAARAGRPIGADRAYCAVEIMAVTKFHPIEAAEAAFDAGIRLFGENRVQEAESKYPAFLAARPGSRLEMIGRLQSNKAKKAALFFSRIQSVDSLEILRELDKRVRAARGRLEILLELHTGEESKAGFRDVEELFRACDFLASNPPSDGEGSGGLVPRGLMTMAPYTSDEAPIRASFRSLGSATEGIRSRFGLAGFDVLSMGMSNDFEIAVEEGSTLLRLGTALFGSRAS